MYNTAQVLSHIRTKWAGANCPLCKTGTWEIQDSLFELRQFNNGNMVVGGPIIPVVVVLCKNCGNTVLINALVANAVTNPWSPAFRK